MWNAAIIECLVKKIAWSQEITFVDAALCLIEAVDHFLMTVTTVNVWERIGEKHLAQLMGEGACQPDIFTKYRLGCELSYGTCPISLCAL